VWGANSISLQSITLMIFLRFLRQYSLMFMREDLYIKIIKFFLIVMCYCRQVYYYFSYKQRNMANEIILLILRAGSYGYRLSLISQNYMINCLLLRIYQRSFCIWIVRATTISWLPLFKLFSPLYVKFSFHYNS